MRQRQDFVACDSGCTWYLVRHGETEWNRTRRIQGQTDTPLNRRGQTQASLLGRRLSDAEFSAVYASDLSRAMTAAAPVRPRRSG
ncbi:MAG: histidine phosphatase family protein, partial [Chloroflexi bacterium]|nr:histidine phosphatase family protein [Chloroflexota bacterium]